MIKETLDESEAYAIAGVPAPAAGTVDVRVRGM
jgi:hypothetical protein